MSTIAQTFIEQSRHYLRRDYLPKIARCLNQLSEEDMWWRPNEQSNSIGNLLLHLCGNVQQWIVSGVGAMPDIRQRQLEFDNRQPIPKVNLLALLRETLGEVDNVLAGLEEADLLESRHIQGTDVTVLEAVYHVVEHFSMHTGQIIWITKQRTGKDLAFYDVTDDGVARADW